MNYSTKLGPLFVLVVALTGCQTAGNGHFLEVQPGAQSAELQIGTSTKAEVEHNFGVASVYHFANGYESWHYQKTHGMPKSAKYIPFVNLVTPDSDDRTSELALLFDGNGILRNIDWRLADK